MLTSEVNFNDIWALTGIPVSPFDGHEEDVQITGSGGIGLVAALGSATRGRGAGQGRRSGRGLFGHQRSAVAAGRHRPDVRGLRDPGL